jgi:hypothetical protein
VIANDTFLGMIDRDLLRATPQGYWDERTVAETMTPAANVTVVTPNTPVSMLIPHLAHETHEQSLVAVVQQGRLCGLIDAEELIALLELEDEFGLFARRTFDQGGAESVVDASAQPAALSGDYAAQERAVGQ